jgi:hypothetical protein
MSKRKSYKNEGGRERARRRRNKKNGRRGLEEEGEGLQTYSCELIQEGGHQLLVAVHGFHQRKHVFLFARKGRATRQGLQKFRQI